VNRFSFFKYLTYTWTLSNKSFFVTGCPFSDLYLIQSTICCSSCDEKTVAGPNLPLAFLNSSKDNFFFESVVVGMPNVLAAFLRKLLFEYLLKHFLVALKRIFFSLQHYTHFFLFLFFDFLSFWFTWFFLYLTWHFKKFLICKNFRLK